MNEQMGRSMGVDEKGRMIIPKEFKEKFLKVREWVIFSEVNPHFEGMGSIKGIQNPLLEFSQILFFFDRDIWEEVYQNREAILEQKISDDFIDTRDMSHPTVKMYRNHLSLRPFLAGAMDDANRISLPLGLRDFFLKQRMQLCSLEKKEKPPLGFMGTREGLFPFPPLHSELYAHLFFLYSTTKFKQFFRDNMVQMPGSYTDSV